MATQRETTKLVGPLGAYLLGLVEVIKWLGPAVVSALIVSWAVNAVVRPPAPTNERKV
jgi:hypothetical protein